MTSVARSPLSTVELFQSACVRVLETTYLGIAFILSAKPTSSVMPGHALAKPSYVTRPSSSASWPRVSSSLYFIPSGSLNLNVQPPCRKPSAPPGSSITPSADTNSVTTIRRIASLLRREVV